MLSVVVAFQASFAIAQSPGYQISPSLTSLPAGSYGATISATIANPPQTLDFNVCFYTGYGSAEPITPSSFASSGGSATATFAVPASTVQNVPASAFIAGAFAAELYTVPSSTASCTGPAQAQGVASTITLNYPTLTSISLSSTPQWNPKLTGLAPSNLTLVGTNFIGQRGALSGQLSSVLFNATESVPGVVSFISPTTLVSTIPTGVTPGATTNAVQVCNTAVYSYCSGSKDLEFVPLPDSVGVVTLTPSTASPTQPVAVSVTFGTAKPTTAGAMGGLVTFHYADVTFPSVPLILDTTGSFVAAPSTSLKTATPLTTPIVADFNGDGLSDLLLIQSGSPVLHEVLGTTPSGSYAADKSITIQDNGPGKVILDAVVADLNNDGFPDIAVLCRVGGTGNFDTIYTLLNDGSGNFFPPVNSYTGPVYGTQILAADFNKDGKQDLVIAGVLNAATTQTGFQVLLGDGTGNFNLGPASSGLNTAPSAAFGGYQIATADFNKDGYPDIAVLNGANAGGNQVTASINVFQNDGTGAFLTPVNLPTDGTNTASFLIGSLAPGTPPDLIITSSSPSSRGLTVALNQSSGNIAFSNALQVTSVPGLKQAALGEFNGDSLLDVAVDDGTTLHVLTGDGKGSFTANYPELSIPSSTNTALLATPDANGDAFSDLLLLTNNGTIDSDFISYGLRNYMTSGTSSASMAPTTFPTGIQTIVARNPGTFDIECGNALAILTVIAPTPVLSLTTSSASQASYGTPGLQLVATIPDPTATGTMSFYNGSALLGTAPLIDGTNAVATLTLPVLPSGSYNFSVVYGGDADHTSASSPSVPFQINPVPATVTWKPNPASIVYGTALSAAQLDATATGISNQTVSGSFSYTAALGTVFPAGQNSVTVTFTPTDPNYTSASSTQNITVTQATPGISWPAPASVAAGTALSSTQLDATATGVTGATLPGAFTYTPPSGTVVLSGTQSLSVLFTPSDTVDYTTASSSVSLNVIALSLSSLSATSATLGDAAKTITITGTGFVSAAVVQVNGAAVPTTYVNSTTLTAVIPASDFLTVQVLQVLVTESSLGQTSISLPIVVTAPPANVLLSGPPTIAPGSQLGVDFELASPYPVDVAVKFNLTFTPAMGLPDDPTVQFASGGRAVTVVIPAGSTSMPSVQLQSGTVAGTIAVSVGLEAGGVNITPASVQPLIIQAVFAAPGIISVEFTGEGQTLTVTVRGFSNTREMSGAKFHFTPVPGGSIGTPDVTLDVTSLYSPWYASAESQQYGSTCTYTQVFNLSSDASVVGQVGVVLVNGQGSSTEVNSQ